MAGRRNEHVRRVLGTYIDEIVVHPTTKTGVMRVNAGLAALVAAGRFGVDDPALRAVRTNGRPRDANGRQRGVNGRPRNANDRPEGRSWASGIAGARYARPRNRPESERTLILESIRAVFWLRFSQAA